jgi:hypothetical protein
VEVRGAPEKRGVPVLRQGGTLRNSLEGLDADVPSGPRNSAEVRYLGTPYMSYLINRPPCLMAKVP